MSKFFDPRRRTISVGQLLEGLNKSYDFVFLHRRSLQGERLVKVTNRFCSPERPRSANTYADPAEQTKREQVLRKFPPLQQVPFLAFTADDGKRRVVTRTHDLAALRAIGATTARVHDVGRLSDSQLLELALADLPREINHAAVGKDVGELMAAGVVRAEALVAVGPYDAERIEHFGTAAQWDPSQFAKRVNAHEPDDQLRCPMMPKYLLG
jgi:hypothetical protein